MEQPTAPGKYTMTQKRITASAGYTLIEIMIVMSIMTILISIAVLSHNEHQIRARETVLKEDLFQMRKTIDQFYADNRRYPSGLSELVETRYLRSIPQDPVTRQSNSWIEVPASQTASFDLVDEGMIDVHSGSKLTGKNGIPYQEW